MTRHARFATPLKKQLQPVLFNLKKLHSAGFSSIPLLALYLEYNRSKYSASKGGGRNSKQSKAFCFACFASAVAGCSSKPRGYISSSCRHVDDKMAICSLTGFNAVMRWRSSINSASSEDFTAIDLGSVKAFSAVSWACMPACLAFNASASSSNGGTTILGKAMGAAAERGGGTSTLGTIFGVCSISLSLGFPLLLGNSLPLTLSN